MPDETQKTSRRSFLQQLTVLGTAGAITPFVISACGGGTEGGEAGDATGGETGGETAPASFSCTDTSGLTEQQIQMRENSQYVEPSVLADKHCSNCQLYTEPAAGVQCGGCQVIAGPIHPQGYCNLWVAKTA